MTGRILRMLRERGIGAKRRGGGRVRWLTSRPIAGQTGSRIRRNRHIISTRNNHIISYKTSNHSNNPTRHKPLTITSTLILNLQILQIIISTTNLQTITLTHRYHINSHMDSMDRWGKIIIYILRIWLQIIIWWISSRLGWLRLRSCNSFHKWIMIWWGECLISLSQWGMIILRIWRMKRCSCRRLSWSLSAITWCSPVLINSNRISNSNKIINLINNLTNNRI